MNKLVSITGFAVILISATIMAQAQTCPVDPVTGNMVAQMISPTDGSTLPVGAVTFTWCNASADYFLTVESVPGAHDIYFAFAGGPGAGVESLTLGPGCNIPTPTSPTTGCIPDQGEPIYVTLWTLKKGDVVPPSPFQYHYTAPNTISGRLRPLQL